MLKDSLSFLAEEVAPLANEIDESTPKLRLAWQRMGELGLLGMKIPVEFGGAGLNEEDFRVFQEEVARTSGSLAFLQTQHQSAGSLLAKFAEEELKKEVLPLMTSGKRGVGVGFSQLRRPGPPLLTATPEPGGFRLDGHVPWVTGFTIFNEFLVGATLPSGEALFGIAPFWPEPGVTFSEPMRLAAMESPQTVTCDFSGWHLSESHVAFVRPMGWIQKNDMINVTLQGFFALGCARAGLDLVWQAFQKRDKEFLREAHAALSDELSACRQQILNQNLPEDEKLKARAWVIDLAVRCAHSAVAATGGSANSIHSNAQRVYREALVYTVSAQTEAIMAATLARLAARGGSL